MDLPISNQYASGDAFNGLVPPFIAIFNRTMPTETASALGAIGDAALARQRGAHFRVEGDCDSECDCLARAIEAFAHAKKRLPLISDRQHYTQVDELIDQAATKVRTIHSFASQFCAQNGSASKHLLIKAIEQLVGEVYIAYGELKIKEEEIARVQREAKPLEPPELSLSDRAEVLRGSRSTTKSPPGPSEELAILPLAKYSVATVEAHSPTLNPHDHLLVQSNYVVSSDGLLTGIALPIVKGTRRGQLSISLEFNGCITGPSYPQLPGYAVTKRSYRDKKGSEILSQDGDGALLEAQLRSPSSVVTTVVTYQQVSDKEKKPTPRSRLYRVELCTPETFPKLLRKFREQSFSASEKAQLVAQAFFSQHLVYERGPQVEQLLSACKPQHKLSFILGLGMGDCKLLSAVLQQLLVHAGLSAVIEGGAVCSPDGNRYEYPGHARVKVYGEQGAIRLDPTLWTQNEDRITPIDRDNLARLQEQLRGADAEQSYTLGREARRLMLSHSGGRSGRYRHTQEPQNGRHPHSHSPGHRLSDDFNQASQFELYKLLATSDEERCIAQVWSMYQECVDNGWDADLFLNHHVAGILTGSITFFGEHQSKLCSLVPQMIQTIAENKEIFPETMIEFVGYIPLSLRTLVLSRILSESTADSCAHALSAHCGLMPTEDSAHFLVRLINLLHARSLDKKTIFDGSLIFYYQKIARLAETFPGPQRDAIGAALALFYGESKYSACDMLLDYHVGCGFYSAEGFPRQVMSFLFPEIVRSPTTFVEKLLDKYGAEARKIGGKISFDDRLVALHTLSRYFDPSAHPLIKPIVTRFAIELLTKGAPKSADFRASIAVAEMCDVVWEEQKEMVRRPVAFDGGSEGSDPCHALSGSFIEFTGDIEPSSPTLPFMRGYLLKQLHTMGLLDIEALAPYLHTPTDNDVRSAWDFLYIHRRFMQDDPTELPPPQFFFQDESYARKAVELYLAVLAGPHSPPENNPTPEVLRLAANEPRVISQGAIELIKVAGGPASLTLTQRQREFAYDAIPQATVHLFSIRDDLRLRSFVRVRAACMLLEGEGPDSRNKLIGTKRDTADDLTELSEEIVRGALESRLKYREVPAGRMEQKHRDILPAYTRTTLRQLILSVREPQLQDWPYIPDGEASMRRLGKRVLLAHREMHFIYRDTTVTPHERARAVVLALIDYAESDPESTEPPQLATRISPDLWRDQVATNLRLQRSESSSRLLRQITQHRNENFHAHRPHTHGDDLRAVDWRASARTSHGLISRTYHRNTQPLADAFHVVIDLADLISAPTFGAISADYFEHGMTELSVNRAVLMKVGCFLQSLIQEERNVTFSAYALGALVLQSDLSPQDRQRVTDPRPLHKLLTSLSSLAESYFDFCDVTQCVPHSYSIAGLMTAEERQQFQQNLPKDVLVLYLESNAGSRIELDPALKELLITGRAARVNIELS